MSAKKILLFRHSEAVNPIIWTYWQKACWTFPVSDIHTRTFWELKCRTCVVWETEQEI
jgi:hypothetical protein